MTVAQTIPELEFDEASHTYRVAGRVVPSVTQVLEDCRIIDYSKLPFDTRQMALERGRHVHTATQLDDEQDLDEASVTEEIFPYLIAWRRFRAETAIGQQPCKLIEWRMHHSFGFAGTLDRLMGDCLVDIKTSLAPDWVAIQLAAYKAMLDVERSGCVRRIAVELHRDSTFRLMEFKQTDQRSDFDTFLAALRVCQYKQTITSNRRRSI